MIWLNNLTASLVPLALVAFAAYAFHRAPDRWGLTVFLIICALICFNVYERKPAKKDQD